MILLELRLKVRTTNDVLQDWQAEQMLQHLYKLKDDLEYDTATWVRKHSPKRELFFEIEIEE